MLWKCTLCCISVPTDWSPSKYWALAVIEISAYIWEFGYAAFHTSKSPRSVVWKYCKASLKEMIGVGLESSVRAGGCYIKINLYNSNLQTKEFINLNANGWNREMLLTWLDVLQSLPLLSGLFQLHIFLCREDFKLHGIHFICWRVHPKRPTISAFNHGEANLKINNPAGTLPVSATALASNNENFGKCYVQKRNILIYFWTKVQWKQISPVLISMGSSFDRFGARIANMHGFVKASDLQRGSSETIGWCREQCTCLSLWLIHVQHVGRAWSIHFFKKQGKKTN